MTTFHDVRTGDAALAGVMTALGAALMVENILAPAGSDIRVDSRSWLMVPLFAAFTVPILWRRRNMLAVCAVSAAALAAHVLAFGWVVRCGVALPLAIALAYGAGRLEQGWRSWAGLVAAIGIQVLALLRDPVAGLAIIPVTAVIGVAAWGIGARLRRNARTVVPVGAGTPTAAHV
jgi:hypothetical protein